VVVWLNLIIKLSKKFYYFLSEPSHDFKLKVHYI